jgi:hypothetical protein
VHDGHPSVVDRRGEPACVGHHPAADGDDGVGSGEAPPRPFAAQPLDGGHRLGGLAFADPLLIDEVKIGVLGGSLLFDLPDQSDLKVSFWSVLVPAVAAVSSFRNALSLFMETFRYASR